MNPTPSTIPCRVAAGQGDAGAGGDRPRYLTPSEVQEVMRRMWARNPGVLNLLFAVDSGELVRAVIVAALVPHH